MRVCECMAHALVAGATAASIALPAPMIAARRPRKTSVSTRSADAHARSPKTSEARMKIRVREGIDGLQDGSLDLELEITTPGRRMRVMLAFWSWCRTRMASFRSAEALNRRGAIGEANGVDRRDWLKRLRPLAAETGLLFQCSSAPSRLRGTLPRDSFRVGPYESCVSTWGVREKRALPPRTRQAEDHTRVSRTRRDGVAHTGHGYT